MVLTFFFAQFFGILMLVTGISLWRHRSMYMSMLTEYAERRASLYPASLLGLVIGLVAVLTHTVWSGGFLPVLVTVIGWVIFLKGVAFLTLPDALITRIPRALLTRRAYRILVLVMIILGLYLFLAGSGGR